MAAIKSAFEILGFEDSHELDVKADMVDRIGAIIKARGLTQAQAGELIGLGQAEVSKMLSGHLDRFTVDRLIKALAALGERVRVTFEPITVGSPASTKSLRARKNVAAVAESAVRRELTEPARRRTPARSKPET